MRVVGSRAMRRTVVFLAVLLATSCGKESTQRPTFAALSKQPASVRGWISDVEMRNASGTFRTVETEAARKAATFQQTNIWIDNAPYVSGGVAENGAFVLLDVPPGNVTISFATPTIPIAHLTLQNIPPNADVIVPGAIIKLDGSVTVEDPKAIKVRSTEKAASTPAVVAGVAVPVTQVPINAMVDRHDYLIPPSSAPVVTVK